ncbi:MAG TPA: hypothetical protein VF395_17885 [Polyangiaceae bacterium]
MTATKGRINARLDSALLDRLEYVQKETGKSATQVLRESLALYCDSMQSRKSPSAILRDSGFIGCGGAARAAPRRAHKDELTRVLEAKLQRRR